MVQASRQALLRHGGGRSHRLATIVHGHGDALIRGVFVVLLTAGPRRELLAVAAAGPEAVGRLGESASDAVVAFREAASSAVTTLGHGRGGWWKYWDCCVHGSSNSRLDNVIVVHDNLNHTGTHGDGLDVGGVRERRRGRGRRHRKVLKLLQHWRSRRRRRWRWDASVVVAFLGGTSDPDHVIDSADLTRMTSSHGRTARKTFAAGARTSGGGRIRGDGRGRHAAGNHSAVGRLIDRGRKLISCLREQSEGLGRLLFLRRLLLGRSHRGMSLSKRGRDRGHRNAVLVFVRLNNETHSLRRCGKADVHIRAAAGVHAPVGNRVGSVAARRKLNGTWRWFNTDSDMVGVGNRWCRGTLCEGLATFLKLASGFLLLTLPLVLHGLQVPSMLCRGGTRLGLGRRNIAGLVEILTSVAAATLGSVSSGEFSGKLR